LGAVEKADTIRMAIIRCTPALLIALFATELLIAQQPVRVEPAAYQSPKVNADAHVEPEVVPVPQTPARPGLSLAELEALALQNNPSLARAQAAVEAARGNWLQVGLAPNPVLGYSGQQIGSGGLAEQHGVQITQEIVRGGKLNLNRQAAAHEVAQAEQELVAQQYRVLTDVRSAYYRVLIAQRQIDLAYRMANVHKQAFETTKKLFDAQEVSRLDVLDTQLDYENARIALQNGQHTHAAAWRMLAAVVGQPDLPYQPLAGDLRSPPKKLDYHEVLQRLLSSSPEIAAAVSNIERARWALQRALVEHKGNINVQALYNWQDNGIGGGPDGGLMIEVPIPVWNKNQGGIIKAQGEVAMAEQALAQLELELQQRLAPVYERYQNARHQVERHQAVILDTASENLELSIKAYQAGELSYLEMLDAQQKYGRAHTTYLDALLDLRLAEVEMEGFLLQNSLQSK
jgi:cobalt-zinc-cadmium efflux system outer membrane protein